MKERGACHFEVLSEMEGGLLLSRGCPSSNLRMVDWVPLKAHEAFIILVWHCTMFIR